MPNYLYKCENCGEKEIVPLPISFDPRKALPCKKCGIELMTRRVWDKHTVIPKTRRTLGQWYKENTGKDLLGGE